MNENRLRIDFIQLKKKINHYLSTGQWYKLSTKLRTALLLKLDQLTSALKKSGYNVAKLTGLGALIAAPGQSEAQAPIRPIDIMYEPCTFTDNVTAYNEKASVAATDIDGDGDYDLVVSSYYQYGYGYGYGYLKYYENTGDAENPVFTEMVGANNPFSNLYTFGYFYSYDLAPTFVDIDGDGDQDLFVGDKYGFFYVAENTGDAMNPDFSSGFSGLGYVANNNANPAFADLDNDGDQDLFVGTKNGYVYHFENDGYGLFGYIPYSSSPLGIVAVDDYAAPAFADLDFDGDSDLIVGTEYGGVYFYLNTGDESNAMFERQYSPNDPFDGLVDGYTYFNADPEMVDLDGDGDLDMLVGEWFGDVLCFENTSPLIPIPTLSQWGIIITGLMLSILGLVGIRRRELTPIMKKSAGMVAIMLACTFGLNAQNAASGKLVHLSINVQDDAKFASALESNQVSELFSTNNFEILGQAKIEDSNSYLLSLTYNSKEDFINLRKAIRKNNLLPEFGIKGLSPVRLNQIFGEDLNASADNYMVGIYRVDDVDSWYSNFDMDAVAASGMKVKNIAQVVRKPKIVYIVYEISDMSAARTMVDSPDYVSEMQSLGMTPTRGKGAFMVKQ